MLAFSFIVICASVDSYTMCFFKSSSTDCPSGSMLYKFSNFDEFRSKEIHNATHFNFVVLDDMVKSDGSRLTFSFDHLKNTEGKKLSVTITGIDSQKQVALDMSEGIYVDIVEKLNLVNVEASTDTKHPSYKFSSLVLSGSVFDEVEDIIAEIIEVFTFDQESFGSFDGYKTPWAQIGLTENWPSANPLKRIENIENSTHALDVIAMGPINVGLQFVGERLRVTRNDKPDEYSLIADLNNFEFDTANATIQAKERGAQLHLFWLSAGPVYDYPVLNLNVNETAQIIFEKSMYPSMENHIMDVIVHETGGTLVLNGNELPISINSEDGPLTIECNGKNRIESLVLGEFPLVLKGSGNLTVDYLLVTRTCHVTSSADLFIKSVDLQGNLNINGSASVTFESLPEQNQYEITVPKLELGTVNIAFDLEHSATVTATEGITIASDAMIQLDYIGEEISQSDIDAQKGTVLKLVCGKDLDKVIPVHFPANGPNGVTSTTTLYSDPKIGGETLPCLEIQLSETANLSETNYRFCVSSSQEDCREMENWQWLSNAIDYKNYVRDSAQIIEFEFKESGEVDFGKYDDLEVHLHGGVNSISVNNINGKLIVVDSVVTLTGCSADAQLSFDASSFSLFTAAECNPSVVHFLEWNDTKEIVIENDRFDFATEQGEILSASFPVINFTSSSDEITLRGNGAYDGQLTFRLTTPGHTIVLDNLAESSHIIGSQIDGTVKSIQGVVALEFEDTKTMKITSTKPPVKISGRLSANTKLQFDSNVTVDECYFGPLADITVADDTEFYVSRAYCTMSGRMARPVPRLSLGEVLTVDPDADFHVSDTKLNGTVVTAKYSLDKLPRIELNSSTSLKPERIILEFVGNAQSKDIIENNRKAYIQFSAKVLCGTHLDCSEITISSNNTDFSGNKALVEASCDVVDRQTDYNCVTLTVKSQKSAFWYIVCFSYLALTLGIFTGDIIYFCVSPRQPYETDMYKSLMQE